MIRRSSSLTTWSLAALVAGLSLGVLGHSSGSPAFGVLADVVKPIGALWVAALQMTVLPLVIALTLAAIVGARGTESMTALGGRALLLFITLLGAAGMFTLALGPPIIRRYTIDAATLTSLQAATPVPEAVRQAAGTRVDSVAEWVSGLIPRNLFEAALQGDILALLLFTVIFAIAVTRLPDAYRDPLARVFQGVAEAMLQCVRWILWGTPAGVFVLTYVLAVETGVGAAGMLVAFVVIVSGLMLVFTVLLYPVSALVGRTTIRAFARAVAPAQLVAVTTRSSIASLPALVQGGREHLRLPASVTSLVLPLSVSLFKVNRTISSPVKLLFLAHVFGIPLGPSRLATFLITVILLSFISVGIPGGGSAFKTMPAYLAAGIPIEGVVIMEAVDTIPDIFKTLLNVTGDMSAATMLSRSSRTSPSLVSTVDDSEPAGTGIA